MVAAPCTLSLLSLLLFFFHLFLSSASQCNPSDMRVLLQLKMLSPTEPAFRDWDPKTSPDCCKWSGIGCTTNGRVTSLNVLLVFGPDVEIPPVIGNLPFLQSLHIHGPFVTGSIPSSIGNLAYLQTLELGSGLTGPIPESLGRLEKLTHLDLSFNILNGSIPSSLGQLTSLTYLDLSSNNLSGSIPDSLGRLTGLDRLDLGANQLTGSIPASFGSFKNPKMVLFLYQNWLSGPIPRWFGQANVSLLDLSENQLTGDASFLFRRDKTALEAIFLNNNHFKFDFTNVELPVGLRYLNIQHNEIYGSLPKELGQLPLKLLAVSYNNLCGEIPTGRRLKHFSPDNFAHNNCLCGLPLPPCQLK